MDSVGTRLAWLPESPLLNRKSCETGYLSNTNRQSTIQLIIASILGLLLIKYLELSLALLDTTLAAVPFHLSKDSKLLIAVAGLKNTGLG